MSIKDVKERITGEYSVHFSFNKYGKFDSSYSYISYNRGTHTIRLREDDQDVRNMVTLIQDIVNARLYMKFVVTKVAEDSRFKVGYAYEIIEDKIQCIGAGDEFGIIDRNFHLHSRELIKRYLYNEGVMDYIEVYN